MTVSIVGFERIKMKLTGEFMQRPMRRFFTKSAIAVQSGAKKLSPVDTGRLRSSITYDIDPAAMPLWAKVGTNVSYAPFMEYGTGLLADGEGGSGRAHRPPSSALDTWAKRHGTSGFAVAMAIARRGGLKPRRYLRGSLENNQANIKRFLNEARGEIKEAWDGN